MCRTETSTVSSSGTQKDTPGASGVMDSHAASQSPPKSHGPHAGTALGSHVRQKSAAQLAAVNVWCVEQVPRPTGYKDFEDLCGELTGKELSVCGAPCWSSYRLEQPRSFERRQRSERRHGSSSCEHATLLRSSPPLHRGCSPLSIQPGSQLM